MLEALSQLKRRILASADDRAARSELMELAERIVKGEWTTGDPLVDKLLYIYEAKFVRDEEEILRVHRELEQKLAGHVGNPAMVVQTREKTVGPQDMDVSYKGPDSEGSYLVHDHHIHFGILSGTSWEANDLDMLVPTERHIFGRTRDQPDSFKFKDGGMPAMYFWMNQDQIQTRIIIGDDAIKGWFRRRVSTPDDRVLGLYGYLSSLFDERLSSRLLHEAKAIQESYEQIADLKRQEEEIRQGIVEKLHAGLPLGLARNNPSLYERVNYWKDYWPPFPNPEL